MKCKTVYKKAVLDDDTAKRLYTFLKFNIQWDDGIKSRSGFTRKAKALNFEEIPEVNSAIMVALLELSKTNYSIDGVYLNYYENGQMWTPNHSHKGTHQLVISLGITRTFLLGKTEYVMSNGDAILFGSGIHGVPKSDTKDGRISIATFMTPI